jgi:uncharacterized protein YjiS (DUF1127 family)
MQTIHANSQTHIITPSRTGIVSRIARALTSYLRRARNRRKAVAMLELPSHVLRDVGLTHCDVVDAVIASRKEDTSQMLTARRAARLAEGGLMRNPLPHDRFATDYGQGTRLLSKTLTGGHWPG